MQCIFLCMIFYRLVWVCKGNIGIIIRLMAERESLRLIWKPYLVECITLQKPLLFDSKIRIVNHAMKKLVPRKKVWKQLWWVISVPLLRTLKRAVCWRARRRLLKSFLMTLKRAVQLMRSLKVIGRFSEDFKEGYWKVFWGL